MPFFQCKRPGPWWHSGLILIILIPISNDVVSQNELVLSDSASQRFEMQVNGVTKLAVHANGGVQAGAKITDPSPNGLFVRHDLGIGINTRNARLAVSQQYPGFADRSRDTLVFLHQNSDSISAPTYNLRLLNTSSTLSTSYGIYNEVKTTDGNGIRYAMFSRVTNDPLEPDNSTFYGVYASVDPAGTGTHYGVYGTAPGPGNRAIYGLNIDALGYAGYFAGRGYFSGRLGVGELNPTTDLHVHHSTGFSTQGLSIQNNGRWQLYVAADDDFLLLFNAFLRGEFDQTNGAYSSISDQKLKKNITPMENTLEKLMRLKPARYHFNENANEEPKYYGLIAQQVKEVFPEVVSYSEEADLHLLSYTELVPVLIKAMQEQQQEKNDLEERVARLEAIILDHELEK